MQQGHELLLMLIGGDMSADLVCTAHVGLHLVLQQQGAAEEPLPSAAQEQAPAEVPE